MNKLVYTIEVSVDPMDMNVMEALRSVLEDLAGDADVKMVSVKMVGGKKPTQQLNG